jgi:flagellar motor protein MotB
MNYAAAGHLAPSPDSPTSGDGTFMMPWEMEGDLSSPGRQESWLLSFIDILAILLTLFVLLLAHQDRQAAQPGSGNGEPLDVSLFTLAPTVDTPLLAGVASSGFAVPGPAPLPLPADTAGYSTERADELAAQATAPNQPATEQPARRPAAVDHAVSEQEATEEVVSEDVVAEQDAAEHVAREHVVTDEVIAEASDTEQVANNDQLAMEEGTAEQSAMEQAVTEQVAMPEVVADRAVVDQSAIHQAAKELVVTEPAVTVAEPGADELLESIQDSELAERVEVTVRPGIVNLEIRDNILFTPASAALSTDGLVLLEKLAEIVQSLPYSFSVEGHTDNVPIHTSRYPSNWELSTARAVMVARQLIEQGIAADRVRAIGYGDTRPRSDNQTPEGRARNRRVSFVLQAYGEQ